MKTDTKAILLKMREIIKQRYQEPQAEGLQLVLLAIDAYVSTLEDEDFEWPNALPMAKNQITSILEQPLNKFNYSIRENEDEITARTRLLGDRIKVEGAKRKLFWSFVSAFPDDDPLRIKKAEEFADNAHSGQFRDSGDPYITHPLEVAEIIMRMGMDADSVVAGLLHDCIEDNKNITVEMISKSFGASVAALVDGVTKLTNASFLGKATREQEQAENVRKMFLAMAKDIRVIPIKLADRLHNMRTLEYCLSEKRMRKARETLEIYAPLAHRLGMGQIKCELEDLAFIHLYPKEYDELKERVQKIRVERGSFMEEAMATIRAAIDENGIEATINGRPKHLYSIYKKIKTQGIDFEQVYDLIAIRVIVKTIGDCYNVLGIIHSLWRPLPFRIKDYISMPKPNGYRSLHTTLIGENGMPFEVQIRTEEMHKTAEFGIAAHWKYKEGRAASNDLDVMLDWVRTLMDEKIEDSDEFMRVLKFDFFSDYVFVFTPEGDIIDLVTGSTPIDFAYRIHSQVGNRCVGAKVNNKIVPLDYKLQMGDIVEIITSTTVVGPRRDWLNIVKTRQAQNKIRAWFKKELKEENIVRGKEIIEREIKKQGYTLSQILKPEQIPTMFRKLSIVSTDDLFAAIGYGSVTIAQVVPKLLEEVTTEAKVAEQQRMLEELSSNTQQKVRKQSTNGIIVKGETGMLVRIARCCSPVPGDKIIGYITRGRGVSVHRDDCNNLKGLADGQVRFIEVEWASSASYGKFMAHVLVIANERSGLMMDISKLFMNMNINLNSINAKTEKGMTANCSLEFEVRDAEHLEHIIKQIKKIPAVTDVCRV